MIKLSFLQRLGQQNFRNSPPRSHPFLRRHRAASMRSPSMFSGSKTKLHHWGWFWSDSMSNLGKKSKMFLKMALPKVKYFIETLCISTAPVKSLLQCFMDVYTTSLNFCHIWKHYHVLKQATRVNFGNWIVIY